MKVLQRLIATLLIVGAIIYTSIGHAQTFNRDSTTFTIDQKTYEVEVGPKGGKFIILTSGEKKYLSSYIKTGENNLSAPATAKTIIYKGKTYPIETGPKGGRYFIYNGSKKYIKTS